MKVLGRLAFALSVAGSLLGALPEGAYLRSVFANGSLQNNVFLFRGGQVARNPVGDLERFDFAAWKAASPKLYGTYTLNGTTLRIAWADGTTVEGTVKPDRSGKGFDYRSDGYAPLAPLAAGAILKGRFSGGVGRSGAVAAFDFTFDGAGGFTTQGGSSASGRYSVSGSTLALMYSDGRAVKWPIYAVPMQAGEKTPELVVVNGWVMTRS